MQVCVVSPSPTPRWPVCHSLTPFLYLSLIRRLRLHDAHSIFGSDMYARRGVLLRLPKALWRPVSGFGGEISRVAATLAPYCSHPGVLRRTLEDHFQSAWADEDTQSFGVPYVHPGTGMYTVRRVRGEGRSRLAEHMCLTPSEVRPINPPLSTSMDPASPL